MKEVLHTFTVMPKTVLGFPFPVDMLRSDHCYPASENDSAMIAFCMDRRQYLRRKGKGSDFGICLCRYAHKQWVPTNGRWESFGWTVDMHGHAL